jgi:hypothetical protein
MRATSGEYAVHEDEALPVHAVELEFTTFMELIGLDVQRLDVLEDTL